MQSRIGYRSLGLFTLVSKHVALSLVALLSHLVVHGSRVADAQCTPVWLNDFPLPGVNGSVNASVADPAGNMYFGGEFDLAGSSTSVNLTRFDAGTSSWSPVSGGYLDGAINALALTQTGDLIMGGGFFFLDENFNTRRIARYNPSTQQLTSVGSLDFGEGSVKSILTLANGDFVVGGQFEFFNNIVYFDADTESWMSLGSGLDGSVNALHLLPNGNIVAGGAFANAGEVPANNLAVFSFASQEWSEYAGGVNGPVHAIKSLNATTLLVGGAFTSVGATSLSASRIAGLNTNTQVWSAYGSGVNGTVRAISLYTAGDFIVGGEFSTAGGSSRINIARCRPSNGSWFSMAGGVLGPINTIHTMQNGDLIVGGQFKIAGFPAVAFQGVANVAKFTSATSAWTSLSPGINDSVLALAGLPNGDILVGGTFVSAGSIDAFYVAKYTPSNKTWTALGDRANSSVEAFEVLPDGDVLVGGQFTTIGGITASRIARYRPSTNTWTAIGAGVGGRVRDIAAISPHEVVVVGSFATAGGAPSVNIAKCNLTTNTWSSLGDLTGGSGTSVGILPNGDIIAGGMFTTAGGTPVNGIALRSAASGLWTSLSGPLTHEVSVIKVVGPDEVFVGGRFDSIGGLPPSRVARYTPSTNTWSSLGSGISGILSSVTAITTLFNGDHVMGGFFSSAGGVQAFGLARYIPADGSWRSMNTFFNSNVFALTTAANGDLFAGGPFVWGGPVASAYLAHASFSGSPTVITAHPQMINACPSSEALFSVAATGEEPVSYRWQIEQLPINSGVWIPLSDGPLPAEFSSGAIVNGATTPQLSIALDSTLGGALSRYRCIVSNSCSASASNPALLTSNDCASCPADFNQDGGVDGSDVNDFFVAWENSEPLADTNLDGGIDGSDVEYFFEVWEAGGCP